MTCSSEARGTVYPDSGKSGSPVLFIIVEIYSRSQGHGRRDPGGALALYRAPVRLEDYPGDFPSRAERRAGSVTITFHHARALRATQIARLGIFAAGSGRIDCRLHHQATGVYYLLGAFLRCFVARLLCERMPLLALENNLRTVRLFTSFFVPFYFFYSGTKIPPEAFQWHSLALGLAISAIVLPARIGVQWLHRRMAVKESAQSNLKVCVTLVPTLIFALVLASILRERYGIPDTLYGALLVYACISTALPSFVKGKTINFDPALR